MAVLDDIPGIKVAVVVGGNEVTEYDDPNAADQDQPAYPTSTKYIECADGAEFSIKLYVNHNYAWGYRDHALKVRPLIDGKRMDGTIVREDHAECTHIRGYSFLSATTNQWQLQKWKFSNISTSMFLQLVENQIWH